MPFTAGSSTWSDPKVVNAMPKWVERCVTVGDLGTFTNHFFTTSNSSDRLRVTSTSPTGNANLRRTYGLANTFCADGEMRVSLYSTDKNSTWHDVARYQWGTVHRLQTTKHIVTRGIATAGGAATLTDTVPTWANQQFIGTPGGYREHFIGITSGLGTGQTRRIINSTSGGVITVDSNWATNPDTTSRYEIYTYDSRGIYLLNTVVSNAHNLFQCTVFDAGNFVSNPAPSTGTDGNGFLDTNQNFVVPFVAWDALPWHMKSRVTGSTIEIAVWSEADGEIPYGTTDKSATWTVPAGYEAPGLMGVYAGHMADTEWMELDNVRALPA